MTARAWLRRPAATIRPPTCPTSLERFPTWEAAELAIHTYDPYTATTPCPHPECGGWHHTSAEPTRPRRGAAAMTARHTVDSITSDELDQLYDRIEKLAQTIHALPDANDAANLAHARAQRDANYRRAERAEARLTQIRNHCLDLRSHGHNAVSAERLLDIIDGRRDEPARTTANNPATSQDTP